MTSASGYDRRKVEAVAKALARANGEDPEMMMAPGEPLRVRHGYALMSGTRPNWKSYWHEAEAAVGACEAFDAWASLEITKMVISGDGANA